MTPEQAAALRAKFPPETIGKLPKPYKKDSPKGTCPECGQYHGLPAMHLDYVGHAAATDRLLQVDPDWTWEPMAIDPHTGVPLIVNGGLWIRLTVCGVTRIGYGDGNSIKEMIGDAIRNAAMRFGVALDLWAKESLVEGQHDEPRAANDPDAQARLDLRTQIADLAREHAWDPAVLGQEFTATYGTSTMHADPSALAAYLADLQKRAAAALLDTPEADSGTVPPGEPAPRRTADEYRDAIFAAKSRKEMVHLLRDLTMDKLGDEEVGDENAVMVPLGVLADRRLKALP